MGNDTSQLSTLDSWIYLLNQRFKIEIAPERQEAFSRALRGLAKSEDLTPDSMLVLAEKGQLISRLWTCVVHLATNHETRFNRNPAVISLVADLASAFEKPRIVSVGCSTGEEPYSLAVELARREVSHYRIHGTDISTVCINTAKTALYATDESIPPHYAPRRLGGKEMQFTAEIKEAVSFEQHNILGNRPISFIKPNIVLTQHMLIYYRQRTRIEILDALSGYVSTGGFVITGSTEEGSWAPEGFERLKNQLPATVFRKLN